MIIPPSLKPGDRVMLIATARKVSPFEMQPTMQLLRHWGLQPVEHPLLYESDCQFAGSDAQRATMLQDALDDPTVRAIFCVRGGYGTVRIVDRIDWTSFMQHPKWLVGYSDVTVLHSHLAGSCATLHAIMPVNITDVLADADAPALTTLRQMLFSGTLHYDSLGTSDGLFRPGTAQAPIVGGNLSILYSLLASPSDLDTRGKILFIEDLDEYLYHIYRMMQALRRVGKLAGLAGLMVGALSDMHDNAIPFGRTAEEIVWEAVKDYSYPVVMHCPMGHIGIRNCALPLGVPIRLTVHPDGTAALDMR